MWWVTVSVAARIAIARPAPRTVQAARRRLELATSAAETSSRVGRDQQRQRLIGELRVEVEEAGVAGVDGDPDAGGPRRPGRPARGTGTAPAISVSRAAAEDDQARVEDAEPGERASGAAVTASRPGKPACSTISGLAEKRWPRLRAAPMVCAPGAELVEADEAGRAGEDLDDEQGDAQQHRQARSAPLATPRCESRRKAIGA